MTLSDALHQARYGQAEAADTNRTGEPVRWYATSHGSGAGTVYVAVALVARPWVIDRMDCRIDDPWLLAQNWQPISPKPEGDLK